MLLSTPVLMSLFAQCAADVSPTTLKTIIDVESGQNPYAIAVVYKKDTSKEDYLKFTQPQSLEDANKVIAKIQSSPFVKSYSVGLMQVNSANFQKFKLDNDNLFDSCKNIAAGAEIFKSCYADAKSNNPNLDTQMLLRKASSCYYSGNETRGFAQENDGKSYVTRMNSNSANNQYLVPAISPSDSNQNLSQSEMQPKKTPQSWDIFGDF